MVKRPCSYQGKCKTLTEVDSSKDCSMLGATAVKWCDYHSKLYRIESELLTKLLDKYNNQQIKNKFGRIIKFSHHSDLSNYLFSNDKQALKQIEKQAMELIIA